LLERSLREIKEASRTGEGGRGKKVPCTLAGEGPEEEEEEGKGHGKRWRRVSLIHLGHLADGEMAFRVKACFSRPSLR